MILTGARCIPSLHLVTAAALFAVTAAAALVPLALVAQVPTRTLSRPELTLDESFSAVTGFRELRDGRILVADAREKTFRLFDPRTGASSPVGREGKGPAEWGNLSRLHALPGDSTLMEDAINDRFLVIAPDGRTLSTWRLPDGSIVSFSTLRGVAGHQMIFERQRPSATPGPRSPAPGIADILRYDRRTQRIDTIGELARPKGEISYVRMLEGGMIQSVTNMPFAALDQVVVAPDGRVAAVRGAPYRVDWIAVDRSVTRGPVADAPRVRVTSAERKAFLESQVRPGQIIVSGPAGGPPQSTASRGAARGGAMAIPPGAMDIGDVTWPEQKPPFLSGAALAAPDGRVWVQRTRAHDDSVATYDVFDASGKVVERVALPRGARLVGFGEGAVWLARPDEDDLLRLERHRIR